MPTLTELARKFHCDKVERHGYMPLYEKLLAHRPVKRLMEVGIGYRDMMAPYVSEYVHGASLKMWRDYFTDAEIYGIDNRADTMITGDYYFTDAEIYGIDNGDYYFTDAEIYGIDNRADTMITGEPRITTIEADERDVAAMREIVTRINPDVVIDDGSHYHDDQVALFQTVFPLLSDGALYITEDVQNALELARIMGPTAQVFYGGRTADDYIAWVEKR